MIKGIDVFRMILGVAFGGSAVSFLFGGYYEAAFGFGCLAFWFVITGLEAA